MKTYYLVKFTDNWADEMDLYGFRIMDGDQLDEFTKGIRAIKRFPLEVYFGTNEFVIYENQEDIMKCFMIQPITASEKSFLDRCFPKASRWGYGVFPALEDYADEY
jgi:hypothetical protein